MGSFASKACGLVVATLVTAASIQVSAQTTSCDANDFRDVVANASASITRLQQENGKIVQEKLQRLREIKHWNDAEYQRNAAPFVRDEITAQLDAANEALLLKVNALEASDASSEAGRCAMLREVRAVMDGLVANMTEKWRHLVSKLAKAESGPIAAGLSE